MASFNPANVAQAQAALALALLVDPAAIPDTNRAILLLDQARSYIPGLNPAIEALFNKPVPQITEAIGIIRLALPASANMNSIDQAMGRVASAMQAIESLKIPIIMWRAMLDSAPTDNLKATAVQKLYSALVTQQEHADALKRCAADLAGLLSVAYTEHATNDREALLASLSQSRS